MARVPKKKQQPTAFKFYDESDFQYELELAREFSDDDAIAKVMLYKMNVVKTKTHSLYGESKLKDKTFLPPIELNVTLTIDDISAEYLTTGGLYNETIGVFKFGVYLEELDEKNIKITIGDYVKYFDGDKERMFEVNKVSQINSNHSLLGYKPLYVEVSCNYIRDKNIESML